MSGINETPCGYEAKNGQWIGCNRAFPHSGIRTGDLCKKCKIFFSAKSDLEREDAERLQQCEGCGLAGRKMPSTCGTCQRNYGRSDPNKEAGAAARGTAMQSRVGGASRNALANELTNTNLGSLAHTVGPATPEVELERLRAARAAGSFSIVYSIVVHASNGKVAPNAFGRMTLLVETSESMQAILDQMVDQASEKWVKNRTCIHLQTRDVELRFKGNRDIDEENLALTLSEFYSHYCNRVDRDAFIPTAKSKGLAKGSFLEMELHVFSDKYESRTGLEGTTTTTQRSKRRRAQGSDDDDDDDDIRGLTKRSASGSGPLVSKFVRDSGIPSREAANAIQTKPILFRRVTVKIKDNESGQVSIHKSTKDENGDIAVTPIKLSKSDRGRSKELYELAIAGSQIPYVAKRLLSKAPGEPVPILHEQYDLLLADLVRLVKGQMFVKRFESSADEYGVEPSDFRFTEAFLITVVKSADPSTTNSSVLAALYASSDAEEEEEFEAVYLVEPRRSSSRIEKYTGTMVNQEWHDLKSATINAFAHFVIMDSACEYLLADLQALQDIREGTILIDPMSHTPMGNSGLGDHGIEGIMTFIRTHACSPICKSMKLASASDLRRTIQQIKKELSTNPDGNSDSE
ncbi:hypothetical protein FRB90_004071 [Tulasnella sp. 427]|nr:hypothetical protein FRB90_004071 [Tulasnella sp. 427]